jgi:hypothetical protein
MRVLLCALVCICTATHALAAALPSEQQPGWNSTEARPGSMFSEACGQQGMAACNDACFSPDMDAPAWCPRNLTSSGCREGLTKVAVTPGTTKPEDRLPDICLAMPKVRWRQSAGAPHAHTDSSVCVDNRGVSQAAPLPSCWLPAGGPGLWRGFQALLPAAASRQP